MDAQNDHRTLWSDGAQSLSLERFAEVMRELRPIAQAVGRSL